MGDNTRMQVRLGALCPTVKEQGFVDEDGHLQRDAEEILRLYVRGYLSESQRTAAEKKLVSRLTPAAEG